MTTLAFFTVLVGLVALERLAELVVSTRNARWSLAQGGRETGQGHYVVMVMLHTGLLVGAYFVLWLHRRDRLAASSWGVRLARQGGVAGALATVLGLSTGPCSVVGCGAPVIPVMGLAFTGLTSTTLTLLARVSRIATTLVLVGLTVGVVYLAWRAGADATARA